MISTVADLLPVVDMIERHRPTPQMPPIIDECLSDLRRLLEEGQIDRAGHKLLGEKMWNIREAVCDALLEMQAA